MSAKWATLPNFALKENRVFDCQCMTGRLGSKFFPLRSCFPELTPSYPSLASHHPASYTFERLRAYTGSRLRCRPAPAMSSFRRIIL